MHECNPRFRKEVEYLYTIKHLSGHKIAEVLREKYNGQRGVNADKVYEVLRSMKLVRDFNYANKLVWIVGARKDVRTKAVIICAKLRSARFKHETIAGMLNVGESTLRTWLKMPVAKKYFKLYDYNMFRTNTDPKIELIDVLYPDEIDFMTKFRKLPRGNERFKEKYWKE